jgi:prepilin-type processing-associated H-X9-DG protein
LVDFTVPLNNAVNVSASQTVLPLFVCPTDIAAGRVPGLPDAGSNYVANVGTGTVGFGLIASGDGVFTQTPYALTDLIDGTSNTAAFSESILGNGLTSTGPRPIDPTREVLEVPGGNDTTPQACEGGSGVWSGRRGGKWIDGHYGNTLYNHYYRPNPPDNWDCGNGSHNKGLSTARSLHAGGVNLLLCDGSVRVVRDAIALDVWRALATRDGGDLTGDF